MGLSRRAYARDRTARGLRTSEGAVRNAINNGRISEALCADGTIDPRVADLLWDANHAGPVSSSAQTIASKPRKSNVRKPPGSLTEEKTRREAANATLAELKLEETRGELVRRDAVRQTVDAVARETRDRLLGLPGRLAAELAGLDEPRLVAGRLREEITAALSALSSLAE